MALRSVLEIDVNDSAFKTFQSTFEKYQAAVLRLPGAWRDVDRAAQAGKSTFVDMAASLMAQAELLHRARLESERFNNAADRTGRHFRGLARDTRDVARNIVAATASLLRWSSITGIIGGLVGAGGLFGIERLAASSSQLRQRSQALGISPTEQQAFDVAFGTRVPGAQGALGQVASMLYDVQQQAPLFGLGMNLAQLRGGGAASAMPEFLRNLQRLAQGTSEQMVGPTMQARGLEQFTPLAIFLRNMPAAELEEWISDFRSYNEELKKVLTPEALRSWQKFNTALSLAGTRIENSFVAAFERAQLPDKMTQLSNVFSRAIEQIVMSDELKHWLDVVSQGMQDLADWLTKPEFKQSRDEFIQGVKDFASALRDIVTAVGNAVRWFTSNAPDGTDPAGSQYRTLPNGRVVPVVPPIGETMPGLRHPMSAPGGFWSNFNPVGTANAAEVPERGGSPTRRSRWDLAGPAPSLSSDVQSTIAASGVPASFQRLVTNVVSKEARGFDVLAGGSHFGSATPDKPGYYHFPMWGGLQHWYRGRLVTSHGAGIGQFEPDTWKGIAEKHGLTDFRDPRQQIQAIIWHLRDLYERDTRGRSLDADLMSGHVDPRGFRSRLSRQQWAALQSGSWRQGIEGTATPAVRIEVHNETGGSAAIVTNQVAY